MTPFQPLGWDHQIVLGLTVAGSVALVSASRRLRRFRQDRATRLSLAILLALVGLISWGYGFLVWRMAFIPLQLCDLALIMVIVALLRPDWRLAGELGFYWALSGTSQAILTPDLIQGFPSFPWLIFFWLHGGVIMSAMYLMAAGHLHLTMSSIWRAWLVTNGYAAVVAVANWMLGTNFGYLAAKPTQPSVLDYLGPWPWYILGMEVLALVLLFLSFSVSRIADQLAQPAPGFKG